MLRLLGMEKIIRSAAVAAVLVVTLLIPGLAQARGHWHKGNNVSHVPKPPVATSTPPVVIPPAVVPPATNPPQISSQLVIGAFNANVGTIDVEFVDITNLYVPITGKQLFVYLENNHTSNSDIASGKYDAQLKSWGAKLPAGTIISFGHEFNLTENSWGGNPTAFKAAYIRVHDAIGSKVKYAWVANNSDTQGTPGVGQYWPGASYVDIVGEDGFDWGGESLQQALQPNFALLKAYATGNNIPLWITSTGTGGDQPSWITSGISWARSNGISGLLYFSQNDGIKFSLTAAGLAALK